MKYWFTAWMVVVFNLFIYGQQYPIKGRIIDAQTQEPIFGASVKVLNSNEGSSTDLSGKFLFKTSVLADSIIISHTGYHEMKVSVSDNELVVSLDPSVNALNEVVVSASREQQSRKDVPVAISKINSNTIQDTRATALYQLLNKVSGVYMVNLGNEQHTMAIRHPISYNALYLYMEEGLPIRPTGIFNHNALYEINMNSIKDIEVIKGPASSLYGSNSIGGAVNFISQNPPAGSAGQLSFQGDRYNFYRADAGGGFTVGKLGVYAGGYASRQDNSWQDNTDFNKYSGTLKTSYAFSPATQLTLTGTFNYLYTQTPGNLDSARFYNRSYGSNQHFTYRSVKAFRASSRINHIWNDKSTTFLTVFFRDNSTGQLPSYRIQDLRDQSGKYLKSAGQENDQSFKSYGFLIQHRTKFQFLSSQLIAGIYFDDSPSSFYANYLDIHKDLISNKYTSYTNTDSLIDNYKIRLFNTAAYVQYEIQPVNSLRIVAGLRYDNVIYDFSNSLPVSRTKFKQEEKNRFNVLAPKIGATYDFGEGRGLYANFSVGFQPPETSDMYSSRQVSPLSQATFYNYEIGGWAPLINKKLFLELSAYNLEGRNEIISVLMPDNTTQNKNAGATRHMGIEYNLSYHPVTNLILRFGGTHARHTYISYSEISSGKTINYDGNRMMNAPGWINNAELTWKPQFVIGFRAAFEWQHLGRYYVNTSNTKMYNGYDLFNLRLGYDLKKTIAKGAGIWLNVLNMADRLYATTVTGNQYGVTYTAAPPRTFSLGVSYSFSSIKR